MGPAELGHVLEVHAVDGADEGRREEDGGPGRDLLDLLVLGVAGFGQVLHLLVLLLRDEGRVDGEHVAQQLAELVDPLDDLGDVVVNVTQVALELLVDAVLVEARAQRGQHRDQRPGRALELGDLARQLVDASGHPRVAAEHLDLDLVDVVAEAGDHRVVAVDDPVEDGVQDRFGPAAQEVGLALQAVPNGREIGGFAVADRQDEVGADEDVHLAELDRLGLVEVARRAQHDEQRVVVSLELRALVGDDRVFDGERVQLELRSERGDFAFVRPVQTDPGHPAGLLVESLVGLGE